MKIYTKTGDKGTTSLFGGKRVDKDDLRIETYGTVDELNALLGAAVSEIDNIELIEILRDIQIDLFTVGSDLATPEENNVNFAVPRIQSNHAEKLEKYIDKFTDRLPPLKNFILPGGSKGSSLLHLARTVCRRGERAVVKLGRKEKIGENILVYLNRLSDLLFVLARYANLVSSTPDIEWKPRG
ncbi:MAG: cob(I)yrinic acid a,c-diamide adenosyltransferase [Bacteroidetes bacterium]|nr:cob(I)yrinic acid a,c-diamide adenosyltransferase [Bacteroidota bacterium]